MVVEVLIAQGTAHHTLHHPGRDWMLHQRGGARVAEAGGQPLRQADRAVGLAEQQRPRIRGDHPAIEGGHHRTARGRCKFERRRVILGRHRGAPPRRKRGKTLGR